MQKITAIIENTFKEGMRQRVLILIGVFSAVLIVVSVFLEPFALGATVTARAIAGEPMSPVVS